MTTDPPGIAWRLLRTGPAAVALLLSAVVSAPAAAAPVRVDAATQVRSIRFSGVRALGGNELRALLETRDRGAAYGLRAALGKLPLVPSPSPRAFDPVGLQRDVARMRRHYRDAGFLGVRIGYRVHLDEARNLIDITFEIDEGDATRVTRVEIVGADGQAPLDVPDSLARRWRSIERSVARVEGRRLDRPALRRHRDRIRAWWRDHGHPGAAVRRATETDTLRGEARVRFVVSPGPAARFGAIRVAGNPSISEGAVLRELPFRTGDPYSATALDEGRTQLQQLEIVRSASFEVESPAPDSVMSGDIEVPVRVNLFEARPRHVSGDLGYGSDAGVFAEARWGHRNFTGSGRSLTLSAGAQSGQLALAEDPDKLYRGTVSLLQPYVFHRDFSAVLSPFVEHRDDYRDRSLEYGTNATLVWSAARTRSASLDYRVSHRRIYEYRIENLSSGRIDVLTFITLASLGYFDSLGTSVNASTFTLSGRLGGLDQIADPRHGLLLRPSIQVTAPAGLTSSEYWRLDGNVHVFHPLRSWAVLTGRFGAGHVVPFGKSLPQAGDSPVFKFLELYDVLLTAGGTADVRGWGNRMLGPKLPDLRFHQEGDSLVLDSEGYTPTGGLSRMTFSLEVRLPLPGLGPQFGSHVFLDGGRVWTGNRRFSDGTDPYGQEKWFYGAGGGIDVRTPVGPVRLSVGYKLNPSITDLVDSSALLQATGEGRSLDDLPRKNARRWQVHLAIGSGL